MTGWPTPVSHDTSSVNLSHYSPTFIDGEGRTDLYAIHTFTVPCEVDYLIGHVTWKRPG